MLAAQGVTYVSVARAAEGIRRFHSQELVLGGAANSRGPGGPTGPLGTPPRAPWIPSR
jgi:hypothetical protein